LNSILGFEFDGTSAPFSIDTLMESIMVFLFQLIQASVVSKGEHVAYFIIVGLLGMGATLCTYCFEYKLRQSIMVSEMGALDSFRMDSFH